MSLFTSIIISVIPSEQNKCNMQFLIKQAYNQYQKQVLYNNYYL